MTYTKYKRLAHGGKNFYYLLVAHQGHVGSVHKIVTKIDNCLESTFFVLQIVNFTPQCYQLDLIIMRH